VFQCYTDFYLATNKVLLKFSLFIFNINFILFEAFDGPTVSALGV
jgi:hypothetical protein